MNSPDKKSAGQPFSPSALAETLQQFPAVRAWRVALSGGADSVALLHALSQLTPEIPAPVSAIHIDHGLQACSPQWTEFCANLCKARNIPFQAIQTSVKRHPGESIEMAARRARYAAFSTCLGDSEALLTAHHQNDQAETLLLNLLNGSGPAGLAAIQQCRDFSKGYLIRPLLDFTHQQLVDFLAAEGVEWIEDPSNEELGFDRNFLRHEIIPRLEKRWPAAIKCIARSARHQREQVELNQQQAELDLDAVACFTSGGIVIQLLEGLSIARQKRVLRYWLAQTEPVINPSDRQLNTLFTDVISAANDAQPILRIGNALIRRSSNKLRKAFIYDITLSEKVFPWLLDKPLKIEKAGMLLDPEILLNQFRDFDSSTKVEVCFRKGGEQFRPAGKEHHRKLKHLFQEWHVPVWQRDLIPLVYWQDELVVVWGYGVAQLSNFETESTSD